MDRLPSQTVCAQRTRVWWPGNGPCWNSVCRSASSNDAASMHLGQALLQIYEQSQEMNISTAISCPIR